MFRLMLAALLACKAPLTVDHPDRGETEVEVEVDVDASATVPTSIPGDWGDPWRSRDGSTLLVRSAEPGDTWHDDGFRLRRPRLHQILADGTVRLLSTHVDLVTELADGGQYVDLARTPPALTYIDERGKPITLLEEDRRGFVLGEFARIQGTDLAMTVFAPASGLGPVRLGDQVPLAADPDLRCVVVTDGEDVLERDLVDGRDTLLPHPADGLASAVVGSDCLSVALQYDDALHLRLTDGSWIERGPVDSVFATGEPTRMGVIDGGQVEVLDLDTAATLVRTPESWVLDLGTRTAVLGLEPDAADCAEVAVLDLVTGELASTFTSTCVAYVGFAVLAQEETTLVWGVSGASGGVADTSDPAGGGPFCQTCFAFPGLSDDRRWLLAPELGPDDWTTLARIDRQTLERHTVATGEVYDEHWMERHRALGPRLVYPIEVVPHSVFDAPCPAELWADGWDDQAAPRRLAEDVVAVELDAHGQLAVISGGPRLEGECTLWEPRAEPALHLWPAGSW